MTHSYVDRQKGLQVACSETALSNGHSITSIIELCMYIKHLCTYVQMFMVTFNNIGCSTIEWLLIKKDL